MKVLSKDIKEFTKEWKTTIKQGIEKTGLTPMLGILQVGEDMASSKYVRNKIKEFQQTKDKFDSNLDKYTAQNERVIEGLNNYLAENESLDDATKQAITEYVNLRAEINDTINNANENYKKISTEYEKLKEYIESNKKKEEEEKKRSEIEKYESVLSGNAEYEELKRNIESVSYNDVVNRCAVMFSKKTFDSFESKQNKNAMTSKLFEDNDMFYSTEGCFTTRYGNIPKHSN